MIDAADIDEVYEEGETKFDVLYSEKLPRAERKTFDSLKEAFVFCDRLTNYDEGSDMSILLKQDGRTIKLYHNREWTYPKTSIYY